MVGFLRTVFASAISISIFFSSFSHAGLIYDVDLNIGGGEVTGTIETDGSLGALASGNIIDWNLSLTDLSGTFLLNGATNSAVLISGSAFTSTLSDLSFNFNAGSGFVLFQNPSIGSGTNYWCIDNGGCANINVPGMTVRVGSSSGDVGALYQGNTIIGSIAGVESIPEPTSLAMFALGMIGLASRRFNKKP